MSKHKLDLHDIYNKGSQIDDALREAMDFCIDRRIDKDRDNFGRLFVRFKH